MFDIIGWACIIVVSLLACWAFYMLVDEAAYIMVSTGGVRWRGTVHLIVYACVVWFILISHLVF